MHTATYSRRKAADRTIALGDHRRYRAVSKPPSRFHIHFDWQLGGDTTDENGRALHVYESLAGGLLVPGDNIVVVGSAVSVLAMDHETLSGRKQSVASRERTDKNWCSVMNGSV